MSSTTASFEVLPFRTDSEAQSEEVGRRMGGISPRLPGAIGPRRGMYQGPYRPHRGPRRPFGGCGQVAVQAGAAPDDTQAPAGGPAPSEQIRWVQFALNQIQNANLPTDGFASPDLRAALRNFQGRNGLPASGFVGPDTIAALQRAGGSELELEDMLQTVQLPSGKYPLTIDTASYNDMTRLIRDKPVWQHIYDKLKAAPIKNFRKVSRSRNYTFKMEPPKDTPKAIGVYRFEFKQDGKPGLYHGVAKKGLYQRMGQYAREINHFGLDLSKVDVRFLVLPGFSEQKLRAAEIFINDRCMYFEEGCVNDQHELESPEIGARSERIA